MGKQLSGGVDCMRGLLLVLNILFVLLGLALIGIGIYIKVDSNFASILDKLEDLKGISAQALGFLAFAMIGGGVFTLLVALLGCMGALWRNRCFLYMYAVILVILMIIELVGFIMALVYKGKLQDLYEKPFYDLLHTALEANDTNTLLIIQDLENKLKCCGIHNISDYQPYPHIEKSEYCINNPQAKGCAAAIISIFETNLPIIGGTLGGVILLELFCLIGAIILAKALNKDSDMLYSSQPGRLR